MLPSDHAARFERALVSLDGLSVGDAFGERFFGPPGLAQSMLAERKVPRPDWTWTDDTAMALSVVEALERRGRIDQGELADAFARRYVDQPRRGYGGGAHQILQEIVHGSAWRVAAAVPFGPEGSFGNGGAMRVAPLGAYFAEDLERLVVEATASAEVTHLHPEGRAGAVAVALAAAWAWRARPGGADPGPLFDFVLDRLPASEVKRGIEQARALAPGTPATDAAERLGSGYRVSAQDTVPFCLWVAHHVSRNYEESLWQTVSGLGDIDTTCAIVGGIVALAVGEEGIPRDWRADREDLKW